MKVKYQMRHHLPTERRWIIKVSYGHSIGACLMKDEKMLQEPPWLLEYTVEELRSIEYRRRKRGLLFMLKRFWEGDPSWKDIEWILDLPGVAT